MGNFVGTVTSIAEKEGVSVIDFQEDGVRKSRDLTTTLNYYDEAADTVKVVEPIDPNKEQPKVLVYPDPFSLSLLIPRYSWYPETPKKEIKTTIQDITGRESFFNLDTHGFQLSRQPNTVITSSEDLLNDDKIKNVYYPQMQKWLQEV